MRDHDTVAGPRAGGGPFSWSDLKSRVSIPQILARHGTANRFRRHGHRWIGPCPIHGGDNPTAFSVDLTRDLWYCFSRCQTGGDSIALAYRLCGGSWPRTARWLTQLAALAPALMAPSSVSAPAAKSRPIFRPFEHSLPLDPHHPFFSRLGLRPATVETFEAGAWSGRGFLEGTVAVRLRDLEGQPLGYAGRRLDPEAIARYGKWKFPSSFPKGQLLYAWHQARAHLSTGLVVVEGAWSVMKLWQAGVPNAVALYGAVVTPDHVRLLARARTVVLFLDADDTGDRAAAHARQRRIHPDLRIVRGPSGTDPADLHDADLVRLLADVIQLPERRDTDSRRASA